MFFARLWLVPSFADLCQLSKSGRSACQRVQHTLCLWLGETGRSLRRRFSMSFAIPAPRIWMTFSSSPNLQAIFWCNPSWWIYCFFKVLLEKKPTRIDTSQHRQKNFQRFSGFEEVWNYIGTSTKPLVVSRKRLVIFLTFRLDINLGSSKVLAILKVMFFFVKDVSFPSIHMSFQTHNPHIPTSKLVRTNRGVQTTLAFRQSLGRVASNHSPEKHMAPENRAPRGKAGTSYWVQPFWPFGGVRDKALWRGYLITIVP